MNTKNSIAKIALCLLVVVIIVISCLGFIVLKQNREISAFKSCEELYNKELEEIQNTKSFYTDKINKLEEELKELKTTVPKKHPIEIKLQNCMKNCNYTTACMLNCTDISIDDWKADIENSLLELKKVLNTEQYNAVMDSQNKWLAYKQAEIKSINKTLYVLDGNFYTQVGNSEIAGLYKKRAMLLNLILDIERKNDKFILP